MKHAIYFAHAGEQRKAAPPLELILYEIGEHDPDEVEAAGKRYMHWLLQNASGPWIKGARKALIERPTMDDIEEEEE